MAVLLWQLFEYYYYYSNIYTYTCTMCNVHIHVYRSVVLYTIIFACIYMYMSIYNVHMYYESKVTAYMFSDLLKCKVYVHDIVVLIFASC